MNWDGGTLLIQLRDVVCVWCTCFYHCAASDLNGESALTRLSDLNPPVYINCSILAYQVIACIWIDFIYRVSYALDGDTAVLWELAGFCIPALSPLFLDEGLRFGTWFRCLCSSWRCSRRISRIKSPSGCIEIASSSAKVVPQSILVLMAAFTRDGLSRHH